MCGPRYAHQPARRAYRAGHAPSEVVLGGRKVAVRRPRVRREGQEVALPTVRAFTRTDPLNRARRRADARRRGDPPVWPKSGTARRRRPHTGDEQEYGESALCRADPGAIGRVAGDAKIVEFVEKGDFGVGSAQNPDGSYERVWFEEPIGRDEIAFESDIFLLHKSRAKALKTEPETGPSPAPQPEPVIAPAPAPEPGPNTSPASKVLHVGGIVPPETWNRLGTKLVPKLRSGSDLKVSVDFRVTADAKVVKSLADDVRQILGDLGLAEEVVVDEE